MTAHPERDLPEKLRSSGAQDGVAAVDRAFAILGALADDPEPSTLAALARRTAFYKSTILRLLVSLEAAGYVTRLRDGRYGLGPSTFRLGLAYDRQNPLRLHVVPALSDLVERGTESASFHVLHGPDTRLCLFRVNSHHATLDRVEAGDVLPLDRGAAGRVLKAFSAGRTSEHEAVRQDGYAISRGERDPNCAGIAAPVFASSGALAGALSLSGPGERFTDSAVRSMCKLLLQSTEALSRSLGYQGRGQIDTNDG